MQVEKIPKSIMPPGAAFATDICIIRSPESHLKSAAHSPRGTSLIMSCGPFGQYPESCLPACVTCAHCARSMYLFNNEENHPSGLWVIEGEQPHYEKTTPFMLHLLA